jgi:hypothetical protein
MRNKIFQNKLLWAVLMIVAVGAFFRAYNFGDWMHYQLDQARDFRVIHAALEYGPGELPLQGPRAAGSFLRLGPLLYYLEYASALVFGDNPVGSVVVILLLNIAVVPVFYLFIREFFRKKIALGLTTLLSVSLFMIVYSRFGWNPNLLPFFMTAFFYSLLKVTGQNKDKGWWLILSAVALAFVVNMHFIALVITPMIAGVYFIWVRPKIKLKWWLLAGAVFIFLNVPLIINDIKTNGENLKEFKKALLDRSGDEKSKHNIIAKGIKNIGAHAQYNWIILTGHQLAGLPEWYHGEISCRQDCSRGFLQGLISLGIIILGIVGWFLLYRKEKNNSKKNFLRIIAIWAGMTFAIFTPLAYDIAPRFFLLNAPVVFILLGFVLIILKDNVNKKGNAIVIIIILSFILSNTFFVTRHFKELAQSSKDKNFILTYNDRILKEKTRITLGQIESIVDWIEAKQEQNKYPVFVQAQSEYERAFLGRINARNIEYSSIPDKLDKLYKQGNYFVVLRTQSNQDKALNKFKKRMNSIEMQNFGTLTVYYLQPKKDFITADKKIFKKQERKDRTFSSSVQPRYLWRQIFEGCNYNNELGECLK